MSYIPTSHRPLRCPSGHPACIAYHNCLKQLAQYLVLPVTKCNAEDINTNLECGACQPFEISVTSRGTAAIIEWVSIYYSKTFVTCLVGIV